MSLEARCGAYTYNCSTCRGGSSQGQPQLYGILEASLGYKKSCLKEMPLDIVNGLWGKIAL